MQELESCGSPTTFFTAPGILPIMTDNRVFCKNSFTENVLARDPFAG